MGGQRAHSWHNASVSLPHCVFCTAICTSLYLSIDFVMSGPVTEPDELQCFCDNTVCVRQQLAGLHTAAVVQTGQHALEAMDSFFESTWGAQSTPASHPEEVHPLQPLMLPISVPLAPPPQQHLSRQNSHAEAHALAAHAAMGSYTLAAAQNSTPALPQLHTKSALHSRRNSSDGWYLFWLLFLNFRPGSSESKS